MASGATQLAQTVLLLNFGVGVELSSLTGAGPSEVYNSGFQKKSTLDAAGVNFGDVANGTVLFANNVCQLEARESGQSELCSMLLFTPDSLIFSGNSSWIDAQAGKLSAFTDALLLAGTLQITGNRFQEPFESVLVSGIASGYANVATSNISTSCLLCFGVHLMHANNIALIDGLYAPYCAYLAKEMAVVEA